MKRRYHDDAAPIPPAELRRAHRFASLSLIGAAIAVALMLAHMWEIGL